MSDVVSMQAAVAEAPHPQAVPAAFDRDGRQLFGWYHPPAMFNGTRRDCVVVMVPPIGYDAACTHPHYRVLAGQLSEAGFAVLRYDHHGTGDSSGSEEDALRVQAWTNGVSRATEFARHGSGARQVCLFGMRLGATIATVAAATKPGLADSVVAWAPFTSGRSYLREMRALRVVRDSDITANASPDIHDAGADSGEEAAGFVLTASTIAALTQVNLLELPTAPAPSLLLMERDDLPQSDRLAQHLGQTVTDLTRMTAAGYAEMMLDSLESTAPLQAMTELTGWLAARYPLCKSGDPPRLPACASYAAGAFGASAGVHETPVWFGRHRNLFGIVSKANVPQADRARVAVLFLSVGSNLHTGPNRMYVTQARVLAGLGFVSLRIDLGGIGESPPAPGRQARHIYAQHSVDDVRDAIAYLKETHGTKKVVLVGVCSGGYAALHTALADDGVSSIVLINLQTFHWREGDSLQVRTRQGIQALDFYRSRLLNLQTWRRIACGEVNVRIITHGIAMLIRRRIGLRVAGWLGNRTPSSQQASATAPLDVRKMFSCLLARHTDVFMVYSANDGGRNEMETHLGTNAARLRRDPHFKLQIVEGADHTFTPLWAQRQLADLLSQHVMRLYG